MFQSSGTRNNCNKKEIQYDKDEELKENKTIFTSPFIMQNSATPIPDLGPIKRHSGSPTKKSHKRNRSRNLLHDLNSASRQPLSLLGGSTSNKSFNLLDDFQNGDLSEPIDIFFSPSLPPPAMVPQNKLPFATSLDPRKMTRNNPQLSKEQSSNRSIFSFESTTDDKNRGFDRESGSSFVSMFPSVVSSTVFDFGSYLRSVTSGMQGNSKFSPSSTERNNSLNALSLDFSNTIKYDLTQETDKSAIGDLELDCVVRANSWDSDVDTDNELELELHLEEETSTESETIDLANTDPSSSVIEQHDLGKESNNDILQKEEKVQSSYKNDYLKYFNQSKTNRSNARESSSVLPSQIPSLYDPFHKALSSNSRSPSPPAIQGSSIPLKIYSDTDASSTNQTRSGLSSQGSDDTLNENREVIKQENTFKLQSNSKKDEQNNTACLPHHHIFADHLKSVLKPIPRNLLNLIVESSDGSLEDATKYATEINSQNSEGIPIPEKTTELVNIPTTASSNGGVRKSAIIRGIRARSASSSSDRKQAGRMQKSEIPKPKNIVFENSRINTNINGAEKRVIFNTLTERREALSNESRNRQNIRLNSAEQESGNNFKGFYSFYEKQQFYKRNVAIGDSGRTLGQEVMVSENKENSLNEQNVTNFSASFKRPRVGNFNNFQGGSLSNRTGKKKVNWAESLEW